MENTGFNKIDIGITKIQRNPSRTVQPQMNRRKVVLFKSRRSKIIGGIILALVLILGYILVNTFIFLGDASKANAQGKRAYEAIKKQNVALAKEELVKTQARITVLKRDLAPISFVGFIPLLGGYYNDANNLVDAASHGVKAAIITTDSLIPYADVLGLKGAKSFTQGSAEDRIKLAVQTMGKVVPKIDEIETEINAHTKKLG